MTLSSKHELLCWLIGGIAAIELFVHSHTFNVIAATYYYGFALLSVVAFLFRPYFLPSRFCATTSPRGVGNNTAEIRPSRSSFSAASRTIFKCELASCIRIRP